MRRLALAVVLFGCGPRTLSVVMNAENNSGQKGVATLTALTQTRTRVVVDIAAANDSQPLPSHIHPGTCGEIGPIYRALGALTRDAADGRFKSATEVDMGLDELTATPYAINVHDARDFALYVSCGELKERK